MWAVYSPLRKPVSVVSLAILPHTARIRHPGEGLVLWITVALSALPAKSFLRTNAGESNTKRSGGDIGILPSYPYTEYQLRTLGTRRTSNHNRPARVRCSKKLGSTGR